MFWNQATVVVLYAFGGTLTQKSHSFGSQTTIITVTGSGIKLHWLHCMFLIHQKELKSYSFRNQTATQVSLYAFDSLRTGS